MSAHVDVARSSTVRYLTDVASRDLRNHTADVLRKVADGETITVTVNGTPAAELSPPSSRRRTYMTKAEAIALLANRQSDPTFAKDLADLAGDTTDSLRPIG